MVLTEAKKQKGVTIGCESGCNLQNDRAYSEYASAVPRGQNSGPHLDVKQCLCGAGPLIAGVRIRFREYYLPR